MGKGIRSQALQLARGMSIRCRHFAASPHGNVAIIFGLCLLPLLMAAGVAIDLSRALIVRERLGHTLDTAALAVGSKLGLTDDQRQAMVQEFFAANYPPSALGTPKDIQIAADTTTVTASAAADVPTTILQLFGYDVLTVAADVAVTRQLTRLEVVMILDNTGSMAGSKIAALKTAASDLVNILSEDSPPGYLKFALVPFANAVNVGTQALAKGWIDSNAQSDIAGENFTSPPKAKVLDLYDKIPNRSWNGCIEERKPPYDLSDDAPTAGNANTLWLPYFAPDEPNLSGYSNSYLPDGISGTADQRQRYLGKYNNVNAASGLGPLSGCTVAPITPLTGDKSAILNAVASMGADGNTHIPIGIAWGRRVLSPGEPYTEGVAYDAVDWKKAAIILTDGDNTIAATSNHNKSRYSAYGYLANGRLGTTNASTFESKLDEKTALACTELKSAGKDAGGQGVEVFTITFNVTNSGIKTLMRNCASSDANYFNSPSNSELQAAFRAIASALSNLRLSK